MNENENFKKFLFKQEEEALKLRDEVTRDFVEKRIMVINQSRSLYQHISVLAIMFLGLNYFGEIVHPIFQNIGFALLMLSIALIIIWLKEVIDKDDRNYSLKQDEYIEVLEKKRNIIKEFFNYEYNSEIYIRYWDVVEKESEEIVERAKKESELRKQRIENPSEILNYTGEIIIFVFIAGAFFLYLSTLSFKVDSIFYSFLLFGFLLLFSLIFNDGIVVRGMAHLSNFISFLERKKICKKILLVVKK